MAVPVTADAVTYNQLRGGRVIVRTSSGIPYVVAHDADSDDIVMLKGNGTTPTSFSEVDAGNSNVSSGVYGSMSAAISSDNVIHVVFMEDDGKTSACRYVTFSTSTDTWGTSVDVDSDLGDDPGSLTLLYSAIAIDANDIPHVAYTRYDSDMGTSYQAIYYNNRIGGAWNGSGTAIVAAGAGVNNIGFDLAINANNIPTLSYLQNTNSDLRSAIGDANDAVGTWTLADIDTTMTSDTSTSICVDSGGTTWYAGVDADGSIIVYEGTTARDTGSTGSNPQLVADGTDIYVFYEDANNDIAYDKWNGTLWAGGTPLETGTFNTAKSKWAFWVDNDSGGSITPNPSFTGTGSSATGLIYGGSGTNESRGGRFTIGSDDITLTGIRLAIGVGAGSPSDNVYVEIASSSIDGSTVATSNDVVGSGLAAANPTSFVFPTPPTLSASTTYYFRVFRDGARDTSNYYNLFRTNNNDGDICYVRDSASWGTWDANDSAQFYLITRIDASELDYTFADEVSGEEDIWFNSLSLTTPSTNPPDPFTNNNLPFLEIMGVGN